MAADPKNAAQNKNESTRSNQESSVAAKSGNRRGFLPTVRFEDNQLNEEPALRSHRQAFVGAFQSVADLQMSIQEKRIYMSKIREQILELQEKIDSKSLPDEQEA